MKTVAELIEGVLDMLNSPDKWCKERLHRTTDEGEQYCLLGALNMVAVGESYCWQSPTDEHRSVLQLFDELAKEKGYAPPWGEGRKIGSAEYLVQFNNAPETEYEDLRLFLKEALERVA